MAQNVHVLLGLIGLAFTVNALSQCDELSRRRHVYVTFSAGTFHRHILTYIRGSLCALVDIYALPGGSICQLNVVVSYKLSMLSAYPPQHRTCNRWCVTTSCRCHWRGMWPMSRYVKGRDTYVVKQWMRSGTDCTEPLWIIVAYRTSRLQFAATVSILATSTCCDGVEPNAFNMPSDGVQYDGSKGSVLSLSYAAEHRVFAVDCSVH